MCGNRIAINRHDAKRNDQVNMEDNTMEGVLHIPEEKKCV